MKKEILLLIRLAKRIKNYGNYLLEDLEEMLNKFVHC